MDPRVLQGNLDLAALLPPIPEIQRRTAALIEQLCTTELCTSYIMFLLHSFLVLSQS